MAKVEEIKLGLATLKQQQAQLLREKHQRHQRRYGLQQELEVYLSYNPM